ncbi:RNA 2',3'-cyclic phosphodiesterase [Fictibacillus iocasae]|uniref:RNA 2',3'-cyclic phosphodiesterase n=1 Tax=Fictibacillus iocasae TaxID=2715437 RepID=A0ABW2NVM1_9BACL
MDRHVFLALPLTLHVKEELFQLSERIKRTIAMSKWVHPQDYHLTLVFLGKADDKKLEKLSSLIMNHVSCKPFMLRIQCLGSYGRPMQPRILWAGIEKNAALECLQSQLAELCRKSGFQIEERPFSPHITLARTYDPEAEPLLKTVNELWPIPEKVIAAPANHFVLFETVLGKEPKYHVMKTYPLKNS